MNSKNDCWNNRITEEFNSGASYPRSTVVLKNCWKNLKAEGRKVAADDRLARWKIGGGPRREVEVDPIMFRVIELIRPTAVGLKNPFDKDIRIDNAIEQYEDNHCPEVLRETEKNVQDVSSSNGDWSQYIPGQLRKPRTTILRKLPQIAVEEGILSQKDEPTAEEFRTNTSAVEQDTQVPKVLATRPSTTEEIAPKKSKHIGKHSTRHMPSRRRPVITQVKNEELVAKRLEALTSVTCHAETSDGDGNSP